MWQRFTERSRRAVFFAQEEAAAYGESSVGTEFILLGLVRESDSIAIRVLERIGIDPKQLRAQVEGQLIKSGDRPSGDMQLTPRSRRVIDLAFEEAKNLKNNYIGTEHLLLGLLREGKGSAAKILIESGAELDRVRRLVETMQETAVSTLVTPNDEEATGVNGTTGMDNSMKGKDLLSIRDFSAKEVMAVFRMAEMLKSRSLSEQVANPLLSGKTLAMIFEKPSLRTRVTFEVGMTQLGGHAVNLQPSEIKLGERESVPDAARNLERWVHGIMARTFSHKTVAELAKYAGIPVINGLSDLEHPCQALADFFTVYEKKGELRGIKLAYIGDGCNTCNSLLLLAAKLGAHMTVGCPEGYEPDIAILTSAQREAKETGSTISMANDPYEAVAGADVVYTDIWTSMGLEDEREQRLEVFQPYQVNSQLLRAAKPDAMVLHCLPAHRGEEITDDVLDGPQSAVFDEAENRLHVQKAILALLL